MCERKSDRGGFGGRGRARVRERARARDRAAREIRARAREREVHTEISTEVVPTYLESYRAGGVEEKL